MATFRITKAKGQFIVDFETSRGTVNRLATFEDAPLQRAMMLEAVAQGMDMKITGNLELEGFSPIDLDNIQLAARTKRAAQITKLIKEFC